MSEDSGTIVTEREGKLLILTLCWPRRLNALSHRMRSDLLDTVREAETDPQVRAIVLTGDGDRSFCAGANIPELRERTLASELGPEATLRKELPTAIERLSKPVVAAVNGYCFGAGLELALGCTFRIASSNASFAQPEIKFGQMPGSGGTQRLYRYVGLGRSMQMILTGEPIDAATAQSYGLVTEVLPLQALRPRAMELARTVGAFAPLAFAAARDAVLRSTESDLLTGIDYERKLYALCAASEDSKEGLQAYAEKRDPVYRGR